MIYEYLSNEIFLFQIVLNNWFDMNIIVNGGTRGIGRELVRLFSEDSSNRLIVTGRNETALNSLSAGYLNLKIIQLDLTDYERQSPRFLSEVMSFFDKVDILINMAGLLINKDFADITGKEARAIMETNFFGPAAVIKTLKPFFREGSHIINISSMGGFQGASKYRGLSYYSASKAAAELVFASYQDSFFRQRENFGAASVRAGNVIGGGDWAVDRIVPDCVRALQNSENLVLRFPGATRPWQHVLEPLGGYLMLSKCLWEDPGKFSGAWNFGPKDEAVRTVEQLVRKFVELWGEGQTALEIAAAKQHEAGSLTLNCDKARQLLGWTPRWSFDRAVEETVDWYRRVSSGEDTVAVSRQQINRYVGRNPK